MCTLTYFPLNSKEYILTSNRDESAARGAALLPQKFYSEEKIIIAPKDPLGGGSWIAVSDNGTSACLLNGAFGRHIPNPPYRQSRGLVLMESFNFDHVENFNLYYDLDGIEPFTLVIINSIPWMRIFEIKWDGQSSYSKLVDPEMPAIWSSPMMYPSEIINESEEKFLTFLQNNSSHINEEKLFEFNLSQRYELKMRAHKSEKIPILGTLSITSVIHTLESNRMIYRELRSGIRSEVFLPSA